MFVFRFTDVSKAAISVNGLGKNLLNGFEVICDDFFFQKQRKARSCSRVVFDGNKLLVVLKLIFENSHFLWEIRCTIFSLLCNLDNVNAPTFVVS